MKKKAVKKPIKKVDWYNKMKREDLTRVIYDITPDDAPYMRKSNEKESS